MPVSYTARLLDKAAGVISKLHRVYGFYRTNANQVNHITRNDNIYPHITILASFIRDTTCVHTSHKMKSLVPCEQLIYEQSSLRTRCCIVGVRFPDVFKHRSAQIFRVQQSGARRLLKPRDESTAIVLELIAQGHNVTNQETCIFSSTAVRNSNLAGALRTAQYSSYAFTICSLLSGLFTSTILEIDPY